MPNSGETFTQDQAFQIVNWYDLANDDTPWEITNNWHKGPDGVGAFFPAALEWATRTAFPFTPGSRSTAGSTTCTGSRTRETPTSGSTPSPPASPANHHRPTTHSLPRKRHPAECR